jgi:hypothetical protein
MAQKAVDLTGKKQGYLTVIKRTEKVSSSRRPIWECLCECGKTVFIASNELTRKDPSQYKRLRYRQTSCGCKKKLEEGVSNRRTVTMRYKHGAEIRNLAWALTEKDLTILFFDVCYYCGLPPSNVCNQRGSNGSFIYSGIDRKDNAGGYIMSNTVSCCKMCNQSKRDLSFDEFVSWIDRLSKWRNSKVVKNGC